MARIRPHSAARHSRSRTDDVVLLLSGAALVLGSLLALAPSVAAESLAYDQAGGDDVLLTTFGQMPGDLYALDIASNGDHYVAVLDRTVSIDVIRLYVSKDDGTTWRPWGQVGSAGFTLGKPALHIAEGGTDLLFLAYEYNAVGASSSIRVSSSPMTGDLAAWTHLDALVSTGVTFHTPSLHSDEMNTLAWTLHLVAEGDDGNGTDVWYARSADQGATWTAGYRIASSAASAIHHVTPVVRYGFGGGVHVVWREFNTHGDDAVRYRRATNGGADSSDWQTMVELTSSTNDLDEWAPSVAASHGSENVLVSFQRGDPIDGLDAEVRLSADGGATWPAASHAHLAGMTFPGLLALPGTTGFVCMAQQMAENYGLMKSTDAAPLTFSAFQSFMDRSYKDGDDFGPSDVMDFDASHANRIGLVWTREGRMSSDRDSVWFDAEWRHDVGYPVLEAGMPKFLPSEPASHPALCELDGDPQSEIVYGDSLGYIRAYNHDGTPATGWPQQVSTTPLPAPVAVGDLDGDGQMEVVVGDMTGHVHAYHHDGTLLSGFPRNLGVATTARVSIGSLVATTPRQIVVNFLNVVGVMLPNGAWVPGWPVTKSALFAGHCAIGDVDDDGVNEVVSLYGGYMSVNKPNGVLSGVRSIVSTGRTFMRSPALADLDLDGDLEILAHTDDGSLYAMEHTGADRPNWPWTGHATLAAAQPAIANIYGDAKPEIITMVHGMDENDLVILNDNGTDMAGWPQYAGRGDDLIPPIADRWSSINSVFAKMGDGMAMGWWNIASPVEGMPKLLPGTIRLAPLSGDVDADNHFELVYLTNTPPTLCVMDLGIYMDHVSFAPTGWWPMYGYNHERQSCLACGVDAVTGVDGGGTPSSVRLEAPRPNPTSGPLAIRFALARAAAVRIEVFDVGGRRVCHLLKAERGEGTHEVAWDGRAADGTRAPAGVYHVRLEVPGMEALNRRVVLTP